VRWTGYVGWEGRGKGIGSQAPSSDSLAFFPNPPPQYPTTTIPYSKAQRMGRPG